MMRNTSVGTMATVLATALFLAGCGGGADQDGLPPDAGGPPGQFATGEIETITVTGKPYVEAVELPGASVHGMETTRIMSKVSGYVSAIGRIDDVEVDIGTYVKKGDVLAVLDVPEMQDELKEKQALIEQAQSAVEQAAAGVVQAEADIEKQRAAVREALALREEKQALLEFRRTEHNRYKELVSSNAARRELLDQAKFQLDAAQAAMKTADAGIETAEANVTAAEAHITKANADERSAEANVRVAQAAHQRLRTMAQYAHIRAPFGGVITRRMVDHGAFVRPASNSGAKPLFEITRNDMVRVVGAVPMIKAPKIELGQPAVCHSIGGLPGVRVAGEVTRSTVVLDENSRMLRIDVHWTNPVVDQRTQQPVELTPGMYCTLSVKLRSWDQLPVVPTSAVATDSDGIRYVMVVEDGRYRQQEIGVAFDDGIQVGISRGVEVGQELALSDVADLADGQLVAMLPPK